jgi:hypothetical protein
VEGPRLVRGGLRPLALRPEGDNAAVYAPGRAGIRGAEEEIPEPIVDEQIPGLIEAELGEAEPSEADLIKVEPGGSRAELIEAIRAGIVAMVRAAQP